MLHGLDSSYAVAESAEVQTWWDDTRNLLLGHIVPGEPVVCFIDANTRMTQASAGTVGDVLDKAGHGGVAEDIIIQCAKRNNLLIVNTFFDLINTSYYLI